MDSVGGVGHYSVLATYGVFFISVAIDVAALSTIGWLENVDYGVYRGLWRKCEIVKGNKECTDTDRWPAENATIAFLIMAVIFKLMAISTLVYKPHRFKNKTSVFAVTIALAGVCNLIAVSVYGGSPPTAAMEFPVYYGMSFDLAVTNIFIIVVIAVVIYFIRRSKTRTESPASSIERHNAFPMVL